MFFSFRPHAEVAAFVHPLDPAPRTAILASRFRSTRDTRVYTNGWNRDAEKFKPAAIAGTFSRLLAAARAGARPTHAVICFAWDVKHLLSSSQRDRLWEAFGVPVFEQILGPGNVLLANECAAHAGLHLTPAHEGLPIETARCACGGSTAPAIAINQSRVSGELRSVVIIRTSDAVGRLP